MMPGHERETYRPREPGGPRTARPAGVIRGPDDVHTVAQVTFTPPQALSTVLYSVLLAPYRALAALRVAVRALA